MHSYQLDFIRFAIASGALRFGSFTLKSGRQSPYFFNTGVFNTGRSLRLLGEYYAAAALSSGVPFDMLYGPAYKGIPLASSMAIALERDNGRDVPVCFNRKEAKDHGEGGMTLGAPLAGRVLIIDDVISAGTSVNESVAIISAAGATPAGVLISLDRQERGQGTLSAAQEVRERHGLAVHSIIGLGEIIEYLSTQPGSADSLAAIAAYRREYGV